MDPNDHIVEDDFDSNLNLILCDYDILSVLGEGTFGKVLKAVHIQTKKKVAIKMMSENLFGDEYNSKRIISEI